MGDIIKGLLIILALFIIIDFFYTENNTCSIVENSAKTEAKCGIIMKYTEIQINFLDRYW